MHLLSRSRAFAAVALAGALSVVALVAPPTAHADPTTTAVNDRVVIDANHVATVDVLANDTAPAGTTVRLLDANGNPTTTIANLYGEWRLDGSTVTHTPPDQRTGPRSIQYRITDPDGDTSTATVTVQVNPVGTPVALSDTVTTSIGVPVTIDVLKNDMPGGSLQTPERWTFDTSTLRVLDANNQPQLSVTNNTGTWQVVDGKIEYTPADGFWGNVSMRYRITNSIRYNATGSMSGYVSPTPTPKDDAYTTPKGQAITFTPTDNDSTPEGTTWSLWGYSVRDGLRVNTVTQPGVGVWTTANGQGTFTPEADFTGVATLRYMAINSRYASAYANITVTVTDPSPTLVPDRATTKYFTAITVDAVANDQAADGFPIDRSSLRLIDAQGNAVTDLTTAEGSWTGGSQGVRFRPAEGFVGDATVTYQVSAGGVTAQSTVTVTVTPLVVLAKDDHTTLQCTTAGVPTGSIVVLENDLVDGNGYLPVDTLRIRDADGNWVTSSVTRAGVGTFEIDFASVKFTPAAGFAGDAAIRYQIGSNVGPTGEATVTFTVPGGTLTAANDSGTTKFGEAVIVNPLGNDTATCGALTMANVFLVVNGQTVKETTTTQGNWVVSSEGVRFRPASGFVGTATIDYRIQRGDSTADAKISIEVTPATVRAADDHLTLSCSATGGVAGSIIVLENDLVDGDAYLPVDTLRIADAAGNWVTTPVTRAGVGTFEIDFAAVKFTPVPGFSGTAAIKYRISSNAGTSGEATVTFTVPKGTIDAADDFAIVDMRDKVTIDVLDNDTATCGALTGAKISLIGADGKPTQKVSNRYGTWTVKGSTVVFDPASGYRGTVSAKYVVTKGDVSDTATITVEVVKPGNGHGWLKQIVQAFFTWLIGLLR